MRPGDQDQENRDFEHQQRGAASLDAAAVEPVGKRLQEDGQIGDRPIVARRALDRSCHRDLAAAAAGIAGNASLGGACAANEIKELRPEALVLLISATHPRDLRREAFDSLADGIVWKGELCPNVLGEHWATHGERARA